MDRDSIAVLIPIVVMLVPISAIVMGGLARMRRLRLEEAKLRAGALPEGALAAGLLVLGACGNWTGGSLGETPIPAPVTVPARFTTVHPEQLVAPADTLVGGGCLNPLVDPATGTQITLLRSGSGIGDYEAPSGAFGIPDGKVIRIDCNTGNVTGLVRR